MQAKLQAADIASEIAHREGIDGAIVITMSSAGALEVGLAADTSVASAGKLLAIVKVIRTHLGTLDGHRKHTEVATIDGLPVDLFNEHKS